MGLLSKPDKTACVYLSDEEKGTETYFMNTLNIGLADLYSKSNPF